MWVNPPLYCMCYNSGEIDFFFFFFCMCVIDQIKGDLENYVAIKKTQTPKNTNKSDTRVHYVEKLPVEITHY